MAKATHTCPSGMGGTFDVEILNDRYSTDDGGVWCIVRVVMPRKHGDFGGYRFQVRPADLKPIKRAETLEERGERRREEGERETWDRSDTRTL